MSTTGDRRTGEHTVESWRDYYRAGGRRVQFVGILGNAVGVHGAIKRVTTASVFILVDGAANPEAFHPADLRAAPVRARIVV